MDPQAWLNKYGDALFRFAYVRVRDRAAAEDLVSETLLAALKKADSFRGEASEKTWLTGILKHKVLDYLRTRFRTVSADAEDDLASVDERGFEPEGEWSGHWASSQLPTDWGRNPQELMERREFWNTFNQCLSTLPERTAALFALHVMDGLSSEELCNDFGISQTNLRVLLYRARKQLRDCLEQHWKKTENGL